MKTIHCLWAGTFFLALIAIQAPAFGLDPSHARIDKNLKPSVLPGEMPVTKSTDMAKGFSIKPVTSNLSVFTKNGMGTSNTSLGGEFPSQLTASATVNGDFYLQWSRTQTGKAEQANLYMVPPNSTAWVGVKSVTMPAQSTVMTIPFVMPNLAAKTYEMLVVGDTGKSSKVTINYTGKASGSSGVATIPSGSSQPSLPAGPKVKVTKAHFSPMVGAPNEPGYKKAELALTLQASAETTVKKIEVEVLSEPFKNPELLTNSKNSPIVIFRGTLESTKGIVIPAGAPTSKTVTLRRTSKNDVKGQETDPGIYSPADWGFAFGQTTNATFRWSVDGMPAGTTGQSPKKDWQWP